ncbi:MAG: amino acid ABC transporter ATP-binding protein [Desulfuromonadia bacterium]
MRLELDGVTKRYGERTPLKGVTLTLDDFRVCAIIGPSGGGKTTLLRILGGLILADGGRVSIDGETIPTDPEGLRRHRGRVGTVFQSYNLFPHLSVIDNITLPLIHVHGVQKKEATERGMGLLERFRLADHARKFPAELSGGEQQRVAIIRAVAIRPLFLLLDEPTSALDPEMTAEVLDLIVELKDEGRTMVIVTHNMGFARAVADRFVFLCDGQVVEEGGGAEFLSPRTAELSRFLSRVLRY